ISCDISRPILKGGRRIQLTKLERPADKSPTKIAGQAVVKETARHNDLSVASPWAGIGTTTQHASRRFLAAAEREAASRRHRAGRSHRPSKWLEEVRRPADLLEPLAYSLSYEVALGAASFSPSRHRCHGPGSEPPPLNCTISSILPWMAEYARSDCSCVIVPSATFASSFDFTYWSSAALKSSTPIPFDCAISTRLWPDLSAETMSARSIC